VLVRIFCPDCQAQGSLTPSHWRCECGGAWEPAAADRFEPERIDPSQSSIWRYAQMLDLDLSRGPVSLGAGWTPLLWANCQGRPVYLKAEYFAPTGSFKDRGTEVMISILAAQGATHVVEDSSGNAGASVAAYAARAGIQADIFVPAHAAPAKQKQIAVYGAQVRAIAGPRQNATIAAHAVVAQGLVLASHAYHPGFVLGQQTEAWEIWEQLGRRTPDWIVLPAGQGVHLLGLWLGFRRLLAAGLISRLPRLVGVQASLMAPLCRAFDAGLDHVPAVQATLPSVAEGLAIAEPVRGRRILQALRETGGFAVMVDEGSILAAQEKLARQGFYVEPTSATALAGLPAILARAAPDDTIVMVLTGSGLKGSPAL
jgi:threonine synthase